MEFRLWATRQPGRRITRVPRRRAYRLGQGTTRFGWAMEAIGQHDDRFAEAVDGRLPCGICYRGGLPTRDD